MLLIFLRAVVFQLSIVVSLADSICRHPDVTLESGLVQLQPLATTDRSSGKRNRNQLPESIASMNCHALQGVGE
jgi:hypothetical protein